MSVSPVTIDEIEGLVKSRKLKPAMNLISSIESLGEQHPDLVNSISDWYRRLGRIDRSYKFLVSRLERAIQLRKQDQLHSLYFELARTLYLMGCNDSALKIFESFPAQTLKHQIFYGEFLLANGNSEKSFEVFSQLGEHSKQLPFKNKRIFDLCLADSLCGIKELDRALRLVNRMIDDSANQDFLRVLYSCRGEYYSQAGELSLALEDLERAEQLTPKHDKSIDRILLWKWRALTLAKLNRNSEAQEIIGTVLSELEQQDLRIEVKLGVVAQAIAAGLETGFTALEVVSYPGVSSAFNLSLRETLALPEQVLSSQNFDSHNLTGRLHELLKRSGRFGITSHRLASLLWPDEPLSMTHNLQRLKHLVFRLRQAGVNVEVAGGIYRLSDTQLR